MTIDYLLTGKEPEEKIVFMSKIELCAKNDDPSLLENLNFSTAQKKDETGKSIMYYVLKYNSYKVFHSMLDTCSHQTHYLSFLNNHINGKVFTWLIKAGKEQKVISL